MTTHELDPAVQELVERIDLLSLGDALTVLHQGLERVASRTSTPDAVVEFARFRAPEPEVATALDLPEVEGDLRCTLPALLQATQRLAAVAAGVQARLDGFTADAFHSPRDRSELLGLPAAGKIGYRDPREFLQDAANISRFEAGRRTRQAEDFRPHASGQMHNDSAAAASEATAGRLGALLPQVSAGFARAEIDTNRLGLLRAAIERVEKQARDAGAPQHVVEQLICEADKQMARVARKSSYDEFRAAVKQWSLLAVRAVSDDPITPAEKQAEEQRSMVFVGQRGALYDWTISTPQDGHEALCALQSAATNPRRTQSATDDDVDLSEDGGAEESAVDGRSREQRVHDAFFGVLQAGLAATDHAGPTTGGPQLIVTAGIATLLQLAHHDGLLEGEFDPALLSGASTEDLMISAGFSGSAGAGVLRRLLCTAEVTPVVLGTESEVLDVGRKHRLFTPAQRKALIARDGGCAAPGCTFPAAWCESHHVQWWKHGGRTSVDNGVLLCSHHHHAVHEGMWEIEMIDRMPWFTATAKLNTLQRDRRPQRNGWWKPNRPAQPRSGSDQPRGEPDQPALFSSGASGDPPLATGTSPPA